MTAVDPQPRGMRENAKPGESATNRAPCGRWGLKAELTAVARTMPRNGANAAATARQTGTPCYAEEDN